MSDDPNDESPDLSAGEHAFSAGGIMMNYAKGVVQHGKMNLDEAIRLLETALKESVKSDNFEYIMKSQVQLAAVHVKRYRLHGSEADYGAACRYSDNLAEFAEEMGLTPGLVEALLLRAILKRTARDFSGARADLLRARTLAIDNNLTKVHAVVSYELDLVTALEEGRQLTKEEIEDIDIYIDDVPGVFTRLMNIEVSHKPIITPLKLYRLVVMNPSIGLPIYTYDFADVFKETGIHIYGLLSAITTVGAEMMPDAGLVRSLTHEGKMIMMEHESSYMGALIADRESFRARMNLRNFLKSFIGLVPPENWRGEVLSEEQKLQADFMIATNFRELVRPETEE
ncbi:MAG: hypothetical protein ACXADS_11320 [Candidatus Thorarchaeota archaeon]